MKGFVDFFSIVFVHIPTEVHAHQLVIGIAEAIDRRRVEEGEVPLEVHLIIRHLNAVQDVLVALLTPVARILQPLLLGDAPPHRVEQAVDCAGKPAKILVLTRNIKPDRIPPCFGLFQGVNHSGDAVYF